jgi:hypothetical protein
MNIHERNRLVVNIIDAQTWRGKLEEVRIAFINHSYDSIFFSNISLVWRLLR